MNNLRKIAVKDARKYIYEKIDTKYLDLENNLINIPTHTYQGKPIKRIHSWISGGTDSALLLYLMIKSMKHFNYDMKIIPMTVRRPRPTNPLHAAAVIEVIEEIFNIKLEHKTYYPSIETEEEQIYVDGKFFSDISTSLFHEDKTDLIVSGITCNPPIKIQKTFNDGVNKEEHKRGVNTKRILEHCSSFGNFFEIAPFININKSQLAKIFKKENLLENLFPVTRSCEDSNSLHQHCGRCWWCDERKWAFGRLV